MFNSFLSTFLVGLFLLIFLVLYLEEELNTYLKIANYYLDLICEPPLLAGRGRPLCESGRNNHCLVNTEDQNKTNKTNGSGHRITLPSLTVTTLQEIGSTTVTTSLDRQLDK